MDYIEWFPERLACLRSEKGVSARDMSLSLGQSESYINKIENKRAMPSMTGFFYICEYLNISPKEFFDVNDNYPELTNMVAKQVQGLPETKIRHLIDIISDMK